MLKTVVAYLWAVSLGEASYALFHVSISRNYC